MSHLLTRLIRASRRGLVAGAVAMVLACLADNARGAVLSIRAEVETNIQELIDGLPGSESQDADTAASDAADFPASAQSRLLSTDLDERLLAFGSSYSDLRNPTASTAANPAEFALEVGGYSRSDALAYELRADAREIRTLIFSDDPAVDPQPIIFGLDGTREVSGRVYFGGAIVFWATDDGPGFADVSGELTLTVTRDDTGEALFDVNVSAAGDDTGAIDVSSARALAVRSGGLELLADQADADALAALAAFDQAGDVHVVLVPFQSRTYSYNVRRGETFDLRAEFTAEVSTTPGGVGAAAAWGRDFAALGETLQEALPEVDGPEMEKAVNAALRRATDSLPPAGGRALCGVTGVPIAAAMLLGLTLIRATTRRGERP
jgi:hypothetical protein